MVVGLSIDDKAEPVRGFAGRNELPWPLVSIGSADKSTVAKTYNVSSIPATFLVGPDGKVLAKDVRADDLEKKLTEVLGAPQ